MTDDDFSTKVDDYITDDDARIVDLAAHFEVAQSTVKHWANGSARPHPRLQKQILRYIAGK